MSQTVELFQKLKTLLNFLNTVGITIIGNTFHGHENVRTYEES